MRTHQVTAGRLGGQIRGQQTSIKIKEKTKHGIIAYNSLSEVPGIRKTTLSYHIRKGEKSFNANGRKFLIMDGEEND